MPQTAALRLFAVLCSVVSATSASDQRTASETTLLHDRTITVATATNTRFYKQELSLLRALRALKYGKRYRLIVYDLGMTKQEAAALRCAAPTLADEVRTFEFDKYPRWVRGARTHYYLLRATDAPPTTDRST